MFNSQLLSITDTINYTYWCIVMYSTPINYLLPITVTQRRPMCRSPWWWRYSPGHLCPWSHWTWRCWSTHLPSREKRRQNGDNSESLRKKYGKHPRGCWYLGVFDRWICGSLVLIVLLSCNVLMGKSRTRALDHDLRTFCSLLPLKQCKVWKQPNQYQDHNWLCPKLPWGCCRQYTAMHIKISSECWSVKPPNPQCSVG